MENHFKPLFHITAEKGWINDPNGLVKFRNKYHIFFQHHPYSCEWGPMHWGHVVSEDLLHFKYLPYALIPGDEFDKDGCFSGSSLVKDDTLYVVYTGFTYNEDPDKVRQIQCLASSKDGIHFTKHGVILDEKDLPLEYKSCDFRDPKLVYMNDAFYLFAVAKRKEGGGDILLYKSKDLKKWEFVSSVLSHPSEGKMLECPDYHHDLGLIMYSEQDLPEGSYCHNICSCVYELGELNEDYKFISKSGKQLLDYGFDFYAAQMIDDGHFLFAWMNMWDRNNPSSKYGFAGMLTCPRKVYIEDGLLVQKPLIFGKLDKEVNNFSSYNDHLKAGTIELELEGLESLSINLREGNNEVTKFYLQNDELYFDRSHSGEMIQGKEKDELSLKGIRKMPYRRKEKDTIYIVMDKYSVEIFVNGLSMSNVIYPHEDSDGLTINLKSKKTKLKIYR